MKVKNIKAGNGQISFIEPGSNIRRGSTQILKAYGYSPHLRAVVGKIGQRVANTQWRLYRMNSPSGKAIKNKMLATSTDVRLRHKTMKNLQSQGLLKEIDVHPLLDVIYSSTPYLSSMATRKLASIYIDLIGDAFFIKERGGIGNQTKRLWTVLPHWVKQTPTEESPVFELHINGRRFIYPREDILWMKDPHPNSPYNFGTGIGETLGDEIDTDELAAKYTKEYFFNRGKPDLIVTAPGLQSTDTKRLELQWNKKLANLAGRVKTFFLNKEVKVTELRTDPVDTHPTKIREFERNILLEVYGMPPEILGIIENSNRATIDSADYILDKECIVPRLEIQREGFQEIAAEFDDRIIVVYENPIQEDRTHILDNMKAFPFAYSVDEIRENGLHPEHEDKAYGKQHFVPTNFLTMDQQNDLYSEDPEAKDPDPGPVSGDSEDSQDLDDDKKGENSQKKLSKSVNSRNNNVKALSNENLSRLLSVVSSRILFSQMRGLLEDVVTDYGTDHIVGFSVNNPEVSLFLDRKFLSRLEATVNATTKAQLRKTLLEGLGKNETIDQLSKRVTSEFSSISKSRARTIARTETVRASNFGAIAGMAQARIPGKSWLSTRSINTRDTHRPGTGLDGQKVRLNEDFVSPSGARGPFPGQLGTAKEDINCRCTVLPEADVKGKTADQLTKLWQAFDVKRRPYEAKLLSLVKTAFKKQEEALLLELKKFQES